MTAPAVLRRWNDPPGPRRGAAVSHAGTDGGRQAATQLRSPATIDVRRQAVAGVRATIGEQLVRVRRVAPLGAVLLTGLVAHVAIAPHLTVRGAAPDVLLVAVAAVAAGRGAGAGAGFGFAAGLGADLFVATPLGTSALAYTLVGHRLGRSTRPRSSSSAAAALCGPDSTCFSCRAGRLHGSAPATEAAGRPSGARRRAAARRVAVRRSIIVTAFGVGAGRLGTAVAATTLGGLPFPGTPSLLRIAGVTLLSAPLGPLAAAGVRRLSGPSEGRR